MGSQAEMGSKNNAKNDADQNITVSEDDAWNMIR